MCIAFEIRAYQKLASTEQLGQQFGWPSPILGQSKSYLGPTDIHKREWQAGKTNRPEHCWPWQTIGQKARMGIQARPSVVELNHRLASILAK